MSLRRSAASSMACLLAGLAAVPRVRAQTPEGRPVEMLPAQRVELVQLEVVITDKHGRPKAGLRREDFVVLEDGTPQPVVQFHAFERPTTRALTGHAPGPADLGRPEGAPSASPPDVPPTRYVVLAIDNLHMEFSSLVPFRKALGRFIDRDLRPEDQVALVTTSGASAVSQEFTADRAVLRQSLSKLSAQGRGWGTEVPHLSEYQAELIEGDDVMALALAVQEILQAGLTQDASQAEQMARFSARAVAAEAAYNSRVTLDTLEHLCRGLSGLTGHKVLFLVSDGFATGLGSRSGAAFDVRRTADTCSRAGVVIHALDTRGLIATPPALTASSPVSAGSASIGLIWAVEGRSEEGMRNAMHSLAAETGGFLVANSNNLGAGLNKMLEDTETYYLLAYDPTNKKRDGSFRRIDVRLPAARDVKVRTRSGYFAPADPSPEEAGTAEAAARRDKERQADMRAAFSSLAPLTAIPVSLAADFVSLDPGVTQVVVSGNVDVTTLPFTRRGDRLQATLDTAALVYDETGAVAATLKTERTTLDLTGADYGQLRRRGIPYRQAAPLKPGRYQVRLATREDATGLMGSAWGEVEIPDLAAGRLALGSLFLLKDDGAAAPQSGPGAAPALHSAQGRPRFGRQQSLYLQFSVYNATRDATGAIDLASQAEVLQKGVLLAAAAPEPISAEASGAIASHLSRIRLQRLEPGDYDLKVIVSDHRANALASRTVPFTVE